MQKDTKKQIMVFIVLFALIGSSIFAGLLYVFPTGEQNVHWHAVLRIFINGNEIPIPGDIGIPPGGDAPPTVIHTHAGEPNILHKEGPANIPLSSFFEAWGKTFNSTCIMDYCNGPNGTVKMSVSHCTDETFQTCSNPTPNYDFENYSFQSGDIIEIDYS